MINLQYLGYTLPKSNIKNFDYITNNKIVYSESNQKILLKCYTDEDDIDSFIKCFNLNPIDLTFEDNYLLRLSVCLGKMKILKYLIDDVGLDISCCDNYAIKMAAAGGNVNGSNIDILSFLIDRGADISVNDNYPLKAAVFNAISENVGLLLKHGVNPSLNSNEILDYLPFWILPRRKYCCEIFKILVSNGLDLSINYEKTFNEFIKTGIYEAVKLFIDDNVNLNCIQKENIVTCIHNACDNLASDACNTIEVLINNGFDFSSLNTYQIEDMDSGRYRIYQILKKTGINDDALARILI